MEQSRPKYQKPTADIEAPEVTEIYGGNVAHEDILSPLLASSFLNEGNTANLAIAQVDEMANFPKTQQDLPAPGS
jgi:hypothetical protein